MADDEHKDPEYNPYLYCIWVVDKNVRSLWALFHHGLNAEAKCRQLNEDFGPRISFSVSGLEAGDKP